MSNDNIPQIEGFDIDEALHRLRGKWPRLKQFIISFANSNESIDEELVELLDKKRYDDAQRLMHSAKGAAANIGATAFSRVAQSIELRLKEGGTEIGAEDLVELSIQVAHLATVGEELSQLE